jgi:magnesium-transporting ATPase (P-type)
MTQRIKNLLLSVAAVLFTAVPLLAPASASAVVNGQVTGGVCSGAQTLNISDNTTVVCGADDTTTTFNSILTKIINIFSVIVGVIAVVMIIVGGLKYITSGGDSTKVGGAKNTILYALIGLVIVALAQVIVKFVLNKATSV